MLSMHEILSFNFIDELLAILLRFCPTHCTHTLQLSLRALFTLHIKAYSIIFPVRQTRHNYPLPWHRDTGDTHSLTILLTNTSTNSNLPQVPMILIILVLSFLSSLLSLSFRVLHYTSSRRAAMNTIAESDVFTTTRP